MDAPQPAFYKKWAEAHGLFPAPQKGMRLGGDGGNALSRAATEEGVKRLKPKTWNLKPNIGRVTFTADLCYTILCFIWKGFPE